MKPAFQIIRHAPKALEHRFCLMLATLGMAASFTAPIPAAEPYTEVLGYTFASPRSNTMAIEAEIRSASPSRLREIEEKLLAIVQSGSATRDAKAWACRMLRQAGSAKAVPVLTPLLSDSELSAPALYALRSIPGPEVDAALRKAIETAPPNLRAGIINVMGARADRQAVPLLAAAAAQPETANAAIHALGQIGGADALRILQTIRVQPEQEEIRQQSLLACADNLARTGDAAQARQVFALLYQTSKIETVRNSALLGLARIAPEQAAPMLMAAMKDADARLRAAAARATAELPPGQLQNSLLAGWPGLPPDSQTVLLACLQTPDVLPLARVTVTGTDQTARLAAIDALGRLGTADDVPLLLARAASSEPPEQAAARQALRKLRGQAVDSRLLDAMKQGDKNLRLEAIRATSSRGNTNAVQLLISLAAESDPTLAAEALKAIGALGGTEILPELSKLIASIPPTSAAAADAAVAAVCQRIKDKEQAAKIVFAGWQNADLKMRLALLRLASRLPSTYSLQALRDALGSRDDSLRDAAIRSLAEWSTPEALPDLLSAAKQATSPAQKAVALRSYVQLARAQETNPTTKLRWLADAAALVATTDEKKLLLGGLGDVPLAEAAGLAMRWLPDSAIEKEAATAVVQIAKKLRKNNPQAASQIISKIREACSTAEAQQIIENAMLSVDRLKNIAPEGVASSPDGLEKDGQAGGDQAAIDGKLETYWDETDNKPLYRFVVTFPKPRTIAAISIIGFEHHRYAPRDFEILCDGKTVKTVKNARYDDNFLAIALPETTCSSVELKITGYYGASPAIRELGIYEAPKK